MACGRFCSAIARVTLWALLRYGGGFPSKQFDAEQRFVVAFLNKPPIESVKELMDLLDMTSGVEGGPFVGDSWNGIIDALKNFEENVGIANPRGG
jgi:hypothetical protein